MGLWNDVSAGQFDSERLRHLALLLARPCTRSRTRRFETYTEDLQALRDWLLTEGVPHVLMESTGSYGKQLYNCLEADLTVWMVNPAHVHALPGSKTERLPGAELLTFGLILPRVIPDRSQRAWSEAVRYRKSLEEERAREANRISMVPRRGKHPAE